MPRQTRARTIEAKFLVDIVMAVAVLALMSPLVTGLTIHEWLGLAVAVPIVVHLLLSWQWMVVATRRFVGSLPRQVRINYVLNAVLFVAMTTVIYSGVMISEVVLPLVGLRVGPGFFMRRIHSLSADAMLIAIGLHVGMNWRWVTTILKGYLGKARRVRLGGPAAAPVTVRTDEQ